MLKWLPAIVVVLVLGSAMSWLAHGPLRRRDEIRAGIAALSAMSWREFMHIVLEAMSRRGFHRLVGREAPAGDSDYTLVRNGEHWLLSAKHGSAFVLGRAPVDDLAADMGLAGAAGGLLLTQGRIDDEARKAARGRPIELLDGAALWPELGALVPAQAAMIREASARRARTLSLAGWLLALPIGVAVFALMPEAPPAGPVKVTRPVATQPGAVPDADQTVATEEPAAPIQEQRRELASTLATLPMVTRAVWASTSTLEVAVVETGTDPIDAICPLVERFPALASSRIQLTPPPDSGRPVRFRQCRSY